MTAKNKLRFEDVEGIVDVELKKRKHKWYLGSISYMDYDDVCQIIRMHINKQWHLYDQTKQLEPWLNTVISNQIKNLLRNNYGAYAKPCLYCPFNESVSQEDSLCGFTKSGEQTKECPVYAKWARSKKDAFNVKLPKSFDNHSFEIELPNGQGQDIEKAINRVHDRMQKRLTPFHWSVYKMLFVDGMEEDVVAEKLGYKTTEKGRKAGYRSIRNMKKAFYLQVKEMTEKEDVFFD